VPQLPLQYVTNFIQPYLHQFFDDSVGRITSSEGKVVFFFVVESKRSIYVLFLCRVTFTILAYVISMSVFAN